MALSLRRPALRTRIALGAFGLFLVNAIVCRELFTLEYSRHMGSIEAAYISISRWMLDHPSDLGWFPLWYTGVPAQNTYPPMLHWQAALAAALTGGSTAWAHHFVTALYYAAGPVGVYLFSGRLSGRWGAAFVAAAAYSFLTPSLFLTREIYSWNASRWNPTRLQTILEYGDGPHVAALALIPFALLALDRAIERPRPFRALLAVLGLAAVVLTNWLGGFALALAAAAYLLARSSEAGWLRRVALAGGIAVIAYLLAAPWIPPSTIAAIRHNAQYTIGHYPITAAHVGYWAAALALVAGVLWLCRRFRAGRILTFSALFAAFTGSLVLTYDRLGLTLMPQPNRYHLELDLAVVLLLVFAGTAAAERLNRRRRVILGGAACVALLPQFVHYHDFSRSLIGAVDIEETVEYQVATFLDENLPGRRVFATGSIQFWLNAFADNPQVGGGFGQGIINRQIPMVHFAIPFLPDDGERAAMWLRLYGAQAVIVSWPEGRDWYPESWVTPGKFDGVLPVLWRDPGEAIYGVPQRSTSLVHAIRPGDEVTTPPDNGEDVEPVLALDAALADESLPLVDARWETPSRGVLSADLEPEHRLFVQIAHHPGWTATRDGRELPLEPDGLGFFVIEPGCDGPCEVTLEYDGGLEMTLAKSASALTLLSFGVWGFVSRKP